MKCWELLMGACSAPRGAELWASIGLEEPAAATWDKTKLELHLCRHVAFP